MRIGLRTRLRLPPAPPGWVLNLDLAPRPMARNSPAESCGFFLFPGRSTDALLRVVQAQQDPRVPVDVQRAGLFLFGKHSLHWSISKKKRPSAPSEESITGRERNQLREFPQCSNSETARANCSSGFLLCRYRPIVKLFLLSRFYVCGDSASTRLSCVQLLITADKKTSVHCN